MMREYRVKINRKNGCIQPHFIIPQPITVISLLLSTSKYRSKDCIIYIFIMSNECDAEELNEADNNAAASNKSCDVWSLVSGMFATME